MLFEIIILCIIIISSFIPPLSTHENAHKWYTQGYDIVDRIVHMRQELMEEIKKIIKTEIDLLEKELKMTRVKLKKTKKNISFRFNRIKYFKHKFMIKNKFNLYSNKIFNHY